MQYARRMNLLLSWERGVFGALRALAESKATGPAHLRTGEWGEDEAFFHLRRLGYTVVARRWRSERLASDLDLVAWDGETLVFFEIKTRTAHDIAPAESQVDRHKERQLRRMASAYLRQIPEPHRDSMPIRFDVLSVYRIEARTDGRTEFEHFRDAFPRQELSRSW